MQVKIEISDDRGILTRHEFDLRNSYIHTFQYALLESTPTKILLFKGFKFEPVVKIMDWPQEKETGNTGN